MDTEKEAHERVVKGKAKGGTFAPMDTSADNFSEGEYDSDASSAVYRSEDEGDKDGAPVGGKKVILVTQLHAFELQLSSFRRACAKVMKLNCEVINCYIE